MLRSTFAPKKSLNFQLHYRKNTLQIIRIAFRHRKNTNFMNQNIIVIVSIVAFIVITSVSVFIYFQNPNSVSSTGIDCSFANDSLLNYLHNPQCSRPLGVELHQNYGCVTHFDRSGYTKVQCEDPKKAWVNNGCLYVNLGENNTLAKCP